LAGSRREALDLWWQGNHLQCPFSPMNRVNPSAW